MSRDCQAIVNALRRPGSGIRNSRAQELNFQISERDSKPFFVALCPRQRALSCFVASLLARTAICTVPTGRGEEHSSCDHVWGLLASTISSLSAVSPLHNCPVDGVSTRGTEGISWTYDFRKVCPSMLISFDSRTPEPNRLTTTISAVQQ